MVRIPDHSPDVLHTRTADMRPAVLRYAENIERQRRQLFVDLGYSSLKEIFVAVKENTRHFTRSPHRENLAKLAELTEIAADILKNPKEYKLPIEDEFSGREAELREIFGDEYVVGFDAVEKAFTLKNGTKALEISDPERQTAMENLIEKLAEPDVIEFIKKLESDEVEAAKWMLVYRTSAKFNDETPVSILGLRDVIDADSRAATNGEKLVYRNDANDKGWYRSDKAATEPDDWATRPVQSGWMFVTRTVVEGTTNKKHADQTPVLQKKAKDLGLANGKFRRRTPQEVLYDTLVIYKAHNIRLLEDEYDWTEQKNSLGHVVYVGDFDAGGMLIGPDGSPGGAHVWRGAYLSR